MEEWREPMKTVQLGDTGAEVSAFCLGILYYGNRIGQETSFRLMDRFVEAGGTFLDTANIYSFWLPGFKGGESEKVLGEWIEARKNREHLFIASKVGFAYQDVERGLRAAQVERECEKSLQRLGTDVIDLYYAHVDDRQTPLEETMEAFDRLVRAGKVRYIGASNFLAWRLERARWVSRTDGWAEYCCIQQRHTYLRPKPGASFGAQVSSNDDLLDYCRSEPVTLLAYSPLLNGAYTRDDRSLPDQYLGPDADARLAALHAVAAEVGATANQVVYAWMMQSDPPVIPLMAASTDEQMTENLGALDITLSAEQIERLSEASA
jgi:aryl-alcohol dehydrogenase-like predicted oxidoreductase